jgi:hypothetical protein
MRAASATPGNTPVSNTPQTTKIGDLPGSTQKTGPKLSTRTPRDLMLDNSTSKDAPSSVSEDESTHANAPSDASGNGKDHFPKTAEKTEAVKPNSGSQQYEPDYMIQIPARAHVRNGGDYAAHGEVAAWANQANQTTGKANRGPQQYVADEHAIPAHAHVLNGGDYATHGEAVKWTQRDANQSRQGRCDPCIIV